MNSLRLFPLSELYPAAKDGSLMEKIMPLWRGFVIVALSLCTTVGFAVEVAGQKVASDPARSSAPPASGTATDPRKRFAGTYRYAGSAEEEEARRAAIDRSVEGFSVITRSTARNRVSSKTQILSLYTFSFEPGKICVRASSRPDMISGDKGEPADYVYNGSRSKLTQRLEGDRISQVYESEDGRRENEFTFSQDGQVLTLKVTLASSRLSVPVVYVLSYKRAE